MGAHPVAHIRQVAIRVFRNGDRILVAPGHDDVKGERFFRPLGGGVELGESARKHCIAKLEKSSVAKSSRRSRPPSRSSIGEGWAFTRNRDSRSGRLESRGGDAQRDCVLEDNRKQRSHRPSVRGDGKPQPTIEARK